MKKLIITLCGVFLIATSVLGATVSNTAAWNVPWGDAWKSRTEQTLDSFVAQININTAGTAIPMASNKVFIGSAAGVATAQTLSGDVETTVAGVMKIQPVSVAEGDIILTEGEMLFGDGGTGVAAVVSGDVLIPKTGIATIQPVSVAEGDIILTEGEMLFGDGGTGVAAVVSGDVLIPKTGIAVIQDMAVVADNIALASTYFLVGNAGGTSAAVNVSGDASMDNAGAVTVTQINSIAVATVTAGAALGTTSLQDADVWGAPSLTPTTNSTSNISIVIQTKNIAGGDLAERRFIRAYCSDTSGGVAADTSITSFTLSTGTAVETFVANADYSYVTAVAGTALLTIISSAPDDKWVTVIDGSSTTEIALTFTGP